MVLTDIIEQRENPRELVDWLEESVDKNDDESSSSVTLDSLVKIGIFRKEKLSVGTRFYLNNQGKIIHFSRRTRQSTFVWNSQCYLCMYFLSFLSSALPRIFNEKKLNANIFFRNQAKISGRIS